MTIYEVVFLKRAKKSWDKLSPDIQTLFKMRLDDRRRNPRIPSARLSGMPDCYKIKLSAAGYRLVYQVHDHRIVILVLSIGKRERNEVYAEAERELRNLND